VCHPPKQVTGTWTVGGALNAVASAQLCHIELPALLTALTEGMPAAWSAVPIESITKLKICSCIQRERTCKERSQPSVESFDHVRV